MYKEKLTPLISLTSLCLTMFLICEKRVGGLFGTNSWISMTECTCKSETVTQPWTWTPKVHTFFFFWSVSSLDWKQLKKLLYFLVVRPLMRHNALPDMFWSHHRTMEVATKAMWRTVERGWSWRLHFFLFFINVKQAVGQQVDGDTVPLFLHLSLIHFIHPV